ncbi:RagB/SusD family nutrient uptake outer membrane protein [Flavobacterium saccharophilum]|uniref:Starch-binding associating with outer membrane n=1 Tax=Flavobacterium saccharophilum TaxID=29534 RepID=A0A1M7G9K0_9FLAO|nr:RagB/SusD family nutrient uptake outer membrane protein [Flavobacterium saccharophilum]SHM12921.1 Starch-binding associating with outer membrane [Flavobacterium saccharophilum]
MKIKILIAVSVLMLSASCSEDFLDKLPETVVSAENFYKTETDFKLATVGMYVPLRNLYGTGLADFGAWAMGEMRSDNTVFIYNYNNRGYADREYVDQFIDDSNGGGVSNKYQNDYIIIGRANQILSKIDAADFDQTKKNNYKGQALFLRAFAYFDLVNYFGSVPLTLVPPTSYGETITPQSPVEDIYKQIIADATEAASLLPTKASQDAGFVANGAAYTLLGNVHITLKQWPEAEAALLKVQGYSLLGDYAALYDPANKNNAESIFEIQYLDEPTANAASNFAYNFLPILADPGVIPGFPSGSSNTYAGWNTPSPELIAAYQPGDLRKAKSIAFYTGEGYNNIPYIKKYVTGAAIAPNTNNDWPVYRYAEVLLFLAEAMNEQGKPQALTYLNQVHANPRTGLTPITISDQTQLRDLIQEERRIELAFENKRWLDLVRTGKAIQVLKAQGENIKANPQKYYYPVNITPPASSYNVSEKHLLFPIPEREIRLNPSFKQNTGY